MGPYTGRAKEARVQPMQRTTEMRSRWMPLLCAAVALAGPASLAAQDTRWPEPGERVRFVSDSISGDSRVAAVLDESFLLEGDSPATRFVVPRDALRRLEVYRGRTSRLKGLLVGGAAGSLFGTFVAIPCRSQPHYTCRSASALDRTLLGTGVGALIGAVAWGGREIWEEVRLRGAPGRSLLAGRDDGAGTGMDTITREEIAAFREGDAMQIVRRLRPGWLRPPHAGDDHLRGRDRCRARFGFAHSPRHPRSTPRCSRVISITARPRASAPSTRTRSSASSG